MSNEDGIDWKARYDELHRDVSGLLSTFDGLRKGAKLEFERKDRLAREQEGRYADQMRLEAQKRFAAADNLGRITSKLSNLVEMEHQPVDRIDTSDDDD